MLYIWTGAREMDTAQTVGAVFRSVGQPHTVVDIDRSPGQLGQGDVVLCMGTRVLDKLKAAGLLPKNTALKGARGRRLQGPEINADFLVTYDPGLIHKEADKRVEIQRDARLAHRLHSTGTLRPKVGKYVWAADLSQIIARIEAKYAETGKPVPVAHDTETMGLYPYYSGKHIVSTAWTDGPGYAWVVDHHTEHGGELTPMLRDQIEWLMRSDKVRIWGANLKFDLQWEWLKWAIECFNFTFDTVIGGSLLDENRHNSLGSHAWSYTDMGGYDDELNQKHDKAHMEKVLAKDRDGFRLYAGGDSDATYRTAESVRPMLWADKRLTRFYREILHPAARAFEKIEMRGVLVDKPALEALGKKVQAAIVEGTTKAMEMIPTPVKARHFCLGGTKGTGLRFSRKHFLVDVMFTEEGMGLEPIEWAEKMKYPVPGVFPEDKMPSTSIKDHLGHFRVHPVAGPFVEELRKINSAQKTLSTYIGTRDSAGQYKKGFLVHLRPGGRFHPSYCLHAGALFEGEEGEDKAGTNTGRLSAKNPSMPTLPKHTSWAKPLRRCYPAPKGKLCWSVDFQQGELRLTGCWADEKNMLKAYREGRDLHAQTAAELNDKTYEEFVALAMCGDPDQEGWYSAKRQGGKAGNFGLVYRMSARGFVQYAWREYGVVLTDAEGEAFHDKFLSVLYPGLPEWHDRQIEEARRTGEVRNPLGRVRHLPLIRSPDREARGKAERQSINSPIQSALSDLCLDLAVGIEAEFGAYEAEFHTTGYTYDSLYGYVVEPKAEEWMLRVADLASRRNIRGRFEWDHQIPFPVDAEIGPNLGNLEKVDLSSISWE